MINNVTTRNEVFRLLTCLVTRASVASCIIGGFFVPSIASALTPLEVTHITTVTKFAQAGGDFASGWKWIFDITVPDNEPLLRMKFSDWTNASNSTVPVPTNVRMYSVQSLNASTSASAITLTTTNAYGNTLNLSPTLDLDALTPGKQVQVTVETRLPSGTAGGSYTTSYGVTSDVDSVAPVITLLGTATTSVLAGTTYTDAGATAMDNIDGNVTSSIVASSSINTSTLGDQLVTYNVTDTAGNPAIEVTRTVTVLATDLTAYNNALASVAQADYTSVSWTTYQSIVTTNTRTNHDAQSVIDASTGAITSAQSNLIHVANMTEYNNTLAVIPLGDELNYPSGSWSVYQTVLSNNTRTNQDSQASVDASVTAIRTAQAELTVSTYETGSLLTLEEILIAEALRTPAVTATALVTDSIAKADFESRISDRDAEITSARSTLP